MDGTLRQVHDLEERLKASQSGYYGMFRQTLRVLSNECGLGHTERISFYIHDGKAFVLQGRYSDNPHYNKTGRLIYPDDQGCIGRAYANGEWFVNDIPDYDASREAYLDRLQREYSIDKRTARAMRMKSRSLYGYGLENHRGHKVAVIVFESMCVDVLDSDTLRKTMRARGSQLIAMLEELPERGQPSLASNEGF